MRAQLYENTIDDHNIIVGLYYSNSETSIAFSAIDKYRK